MADIEEKKFSILSAEDAAIISKSNPARKRVLLTVLKHIDKVIRERAEAGLRFASCTVNFDGFDLEEAIVENLSGYQVSFPKNSWNDVGYTGEAEVLIKW